MNNLIWTLFTEAAPRAGINVVLYLPKEYPGSRYLSVYIKPNEDILLAARYFGATHWAVLTPPQENNG